MGKPVASQSATKPKPKLAAKVVPSDESDLDIVSDDDDQELHSLKEQINSKINARESTSAPAKRKKTGEPTVAETKTAATASDSKTAPAPAPAPAACLRT